MTYYMRYSVKDGRALIGLAREVVTFELKKEPNNPSELNEETYVPPQKIQDCYSRPQAVFVTIYNGEELRGCIRNLNFEEGTLWQGIIEAARGAAFGDTRFLHVEQEELEHILFEISLLTKPEVIEVCDWHEYPGKIKLGRDGLIIEYSGHTGLLLPQIPIKNGWDPLRYLDELCKKAGLHAGRWEYKGVIISSFQAQVFEEVNPNREVVEKPTSQSSV